MIKTATSRTMQNFSNRLIDVEFMCLYFAFRFKLELLSNHFFV